MPPEYITPPTQDELVLSPGMASLVMVVFTLPRPDGWDFRGLQELDSIVPSHVLKLLGEEILGQFNRREIAARPTVGEVRAMAFAVMAMHHHLGSVLATKPTPTRFRRGRRPLPPEKRC